MSPQGGEVLGIAILSLQIALTATVIACLLGIPLGFALGWTRFAGRRVLLALLNTALALPTVVIGLLIWTAYDMARSVFGAGKVGWSAALAARWDGVLLALGSFAILTFTSVNPVWVILGAAVYGLIFYR